MGSFGGLGAEPPTRLSARRLSGVHGPQTPAGVKGAEHSL